MGACFSCLPRIFSEDGTSRTASAGSDGSRWWRRCRHFVSCCGMCDALCERPEEQDATSGPLLQTTENSSGAVSDPHNSHLDTQHHMAAVSSSLSQEKVGTHLLQTQIGETHYRSSSGSGHCAEPLVIEQGKVKGRGIDRKLDISKVPLPSKNGKSEAITSLLDDDDICPTCLDGYDAENPKIITKCGHHFHLACILEWMERSNRCPLCDQEMIFSESP